MSFASVENYWLVFCGYYHGELLDRSHGGLLSSGNCWCLQFLGRSVSTLSPIPMTTGSGGREKTWSGATADRKRSGRTRSARRERSCRRRMRRGGMEDRLGSRTCPCSMLVGLRCLRTGPVVAYRLHTESVVILSLLILEVLDLCRSIRLPS